MQSGLHSRFRNWRSVVFLAAATGALWWGLYQLGPRAKWLKVEGPKQAVVGQQLTLRVYLAHLHEPCYLSADLHWASTREKLEGYLSTGGSKSVGKDGGTFEFSVPVPPRDGLRFVNGIIFLSRTGSWQDHTRMAATELIPASDDATRSIEPPLQRLRVQSVEQGAKKRPPPAALPRFLTALLFLASAVVAWGARHEAADFRGDSEPRWWKRLAVVLLLACLWELLGLQDWLGVQARAIARAEDVYYSRRVFQNAITSAVMASTAMFLVHVSRRARKSRRFLYAALGLYMGISVVSMLSLHAIDTFAEASWHRVTVVQTLKLACALMIFQGVRRERQATEIRN